MEEDLKNYLESKFGGVHESLDLLREDVRGHGKTLYGEDGRGGIVADISMIKTAGKIIAGIFTSALTAIGIMK